MSVTGIGSGYTDLDSIWSYGTTAADPTSDSSSTSAAKEDDKSSKADSITFSRPAEMLSKLQQLKTEDPEKFKKVISELVTQLESAAQEQSGTIAGNVIDIWAKKLQAVADTGDLSQLSSSKLNSGTMGIGAYYSQQQMSLVDFLGNNDQNGSGNDIGSLLSSFVSDAAGSILG